MSELVGMFVPLVKNCIVGTQPHRFVIFCINGMHQVITKGVFFSGLVLDVSKGGFVENQFVYSTCCRSDP